MQDEGAGRSRQGDAGGRSAGAKRGESPGGNGFFRGWFVFVVRLLRDVTWLARGKRQGSGGRGTGAPGAREEGGGGRSGAGNGMDGERVKRGNQ